MSEQHSQLQAPVYHKPTVSPESLVIAVAQQLIAALKGNIPGGNETREGLTKVSKLFTRIAAMKQKVAAAKSTTKQAMSSPCSAADTTTSKGGSASSKGGHHHSKGGSP
jgi:hypothetical protein